MWAVSLALWPSVSGNKSYMPCANSYFIMMGSPNCCGDIHVCMLCSVVQCSLELVIDGQELIHVSRHAKAVKEHPTAHNGIARYNHIWKAGNALCALAVCLCNRGGIAYTNQLPNKVMAA